MNRPFQNKQNNLKYIFHLLSVNKRFLTENYSSSPFIIPRFNQKSPLSAPEWQHICKFKETKILILLHSLSPSLSLTLPPQQTKRRSLDAFAKMRQKLNLMDWLANLPVGLCDPFYKSNSSDLEMICGH